MIMKIAIFFDNSSHNGRDLREIEKGNPGMGATDYMFFLIGHLLSLRENGIDVTMMLTHPMIFVDGVHQEICKSLTNAYESCCEHRINYMIVQHGSRYVKEIKTLQKKGKTKLIVWCENFVDTKDWSFYATCPFIERLIAVSREQADAYRDHRLYLKTDWIFNCVVIPDSYLENIVSPSDRKPIVTYIGAVIPGKGFHLLARAWPQVLREIPDAELYVIGNGGLYGSKVQFGKWHLAEKSYEDSFMGFLSDGDKLLPGVHLMGVLGNEKFDILRETKVGVPNPSGLTETFCNSGVEMQMMGATIASRRCIAYMDTVYNGTLVKDPNQLADAIIKELLSKEDRYSETRTYIENNFSPKVVIAQWEKLFQESLPNGEKLHELLPLTNPNFECKKWKERMRRIKISSPWLYSVVPSIGTYTEWYKTISWAIWKRLNLRTGFLSRRVRTIP